MKATNQKTPWTLPLLLVAAVLLAPIVMVMIIRSGPRWELSTTNTPAGIDVDVYKEGEVEPTFKTLLSNHQSPQDLHRVNIDTFPSSAGNTTHWDETVKPGRWTVVIDGVEIDMIERALIIDKTTEIDPLK